MPVQHAGAGTGGIEQYLCKHAFKRQCRAVAHARKHVGKPETAHGSMAAASCFWRISHAITAPLLPVNSAASAVLPPGALHKSATRSPCATSRSATIHPDEGACTVHSPSLKSESTSGSTCFLSL